MAEGEVASLKEALCNQYVIMKKLYTELEEEREASATATSEALSMILRLQREKATEKMEACQYKRIAEEKMHHVEECLAILEDVTQQKEIEITSLRYQLEAYTKKLLSLGIKIPDVGLITAFENKCCRSNSPLDKTSIHGLIRRYASLPSLRCELPCSEMDINVEDNTQFPRRQSLWKKFSEKFDESGLPKFFDDAATGDSSDWKQAEEVNKKMKELIQPKNAKEAGSRSNVVVNELQRPPSIGSFSSEQESGSCSWHSAVSGYTSCDSIAGGTCRKSEDEAVSCLRSHADETENIPEFDVHNSSYLEPNLNENTVNSPGVHDIFEVPESNKSYNANGPCMTVLEDSIQDTKNMVGVVNLARQDSLDYLLRDDDCVNMSFMSGQYVNRLASPRIEPLPHLGSKLNTPRKGTLGNCRDTLVDPKIEIGASQIDFEQLKLQLKQLEVERIFVKEDIQSDREQIELLREIFKQLNTIETQIKSSTPRKGAAQDDSKVVSVMEAVLSFSI